MLCTWFPWAPSVLTLKLVKATRETGVERRGGHGIHTRWRRLLPLGKLFLRFLSKFNFHLIQFSDSLLYKNHHHGSEIQNTVEHGYCDYHLVTKIGYCNCFALLKSVLLWLLCTIENCFWFNFALVPRLREKRYLFCKYEVRYTFSKGTWTIGPRPPRAQTFLGLLQVSLCYRPF